MLKAEGLIGRQIDQFRLDAFIARGAMGMVFKAIDTVLARTVALKLIPKGMEEDLSDAEILTREEAKKRLIQEAKAAGRLAHPNIVTVHSYGETNDFQYICMEYVSGRTLSRLFRERGGMSEEECVPIFEQILQALDAANGENIIHRDIKPSNIMITDDGRVKVMDFGIAKLPSLSMTITGMVLGTPFYMSPEQISGKKVDIRSDIFSLGAVLYEALTGAKPFQGESTATLTYKIIQVDPEPPGALNARISEAMTRIILRALAKNPAVRYQTPSEMLADLRSLYRRESVESREEDKTVAALKEPSPVATTPVERREGVQPVEAFAHSVPARPEVDESLSAHGTPASVKETEREKQWAPGEEQESPTPLVPGTKKPHTRGDARQDASGRAEPGRDIRVSRPLAIAALIVIVVMAGVMFLRFMKARQQPPASRTAVVVTPSPTVAGDGRPPVAQALPGSDKLSKYPEAQAPPPAVGRATAGLPSAVSSDVRPPEAQTGLDQERHRSSLSSQIAPPGSSPVVPANPPFVDAGDVKSPQSQAFSEKERLRSTLDLLLLDAGKNFVSNPAAAQKLLEQALSLEPNHFESLMMLARLSTFQKDYKGAIQRYQEALRVNSQAAEAYFEVGCLQLAQGDCEAAIRSLEACLAFMPRNRDDVLTNLGFCYWKTNKSQQARVAYQQALEFNPKNERAKGLMASLTPVAPPPKPSVQPQPAPSEAPAANAVQVEGKYSVQGVNPNGSKYHGSATITRSGQKYTMSWNIANQAFSGSGSLSGKTLSIDWKGSKGGGGTVVYTVSAGGVLKGVWAGGQGSETLTPVK